MKTTPNQPSYSKYTFRECSGYIVAPWISGVTHELVTIRHSASASPWVDRDIHVHSDSEEYYFVFQGELQLVVAGSRYYRKLWIAGMKEAAYPWGETHPHIGGRGTAERIRHVQAYHE